MCIHHLDKKASIIIQIPLVCHIQAPAIRIPQILPELLIRRVFPLLDSINASLQAPRSLVVQTSTIAIVTFIVILVLGILLASHAHRMFEAVFATEAGYWLCTAAVLAGVDCTVLRVGHRVVGADGLSTGGVSIVGVVAVGVFVFRGACAAGLMFFAAGCAVSPVVAGIVTACVGDTVVPS